MANGKPECKWCEAGSKRILWPADGIAVGPELVHKVGRAEGLLDAYTVLCTGPQRQGGDRRTRTPELKRAWRRPDMYRDHNTNWQIDRRTPGRDRRKGGTR